MKVFRAAKGQQDETLLLHEGEVNWYHKGQVKQKSFLWVAIDAGTPKAPKHQFSVAQVSYAKIVER